MNYELEVCIDNLESLHYAIEGGATRIELCSSLALGGLTPSVGMMKQAAHLSTIPVYAMIRPRQGDFLYDDDDIQSMMFDIDAAAHSGLQGVVLGVLTAQGDVDMEKANRLVSYAKQLGLGVTFHRAIDQCRDVRQAIEDISILGCERILTSGHASNVVEGIDGLSEMVQHADGRFNVMAGAGLSANNVAHIIQHTNVKEVHLSGKSTRASRMYIKADSAKMGSQNLDDFIVPITNPEAIRAVADILKSL